LFEYEVVGEECIAENNCLLVSRSGCACAKYCMSSDFDDFTQFKVDIRAAITVINKTLRDR
jgi:hypothetical protein